MHTNKSAALSNPLTHLLPGSASGQQRNAGTEPGASFATLFKSSREQAPAAPPRPAATAPAPAPAPAQATAAPQGATAPKPPASKPGGTRQQAQAGEEVQAKGSEADAGTDAAVSTTDGKPGARHAATRQQAAAQATEADPRAAADATGLATDARPADLAKVADDAGDGKAEAGSEDESGTAAGAQPPQAVAAMPVPVLTAEQLASQLQNTTRQAASDQPAETGSEPGAAAGKEQRIAGAHARPAGPELAAADTVAAATSTPQGMASAASQGDPLVRPELAAAQTASAETPAAPLKPASAEGGAAPSFQQLLAQAGQTQASGPAGPAGPSADTRTLSIRQELHGPGFAPAMGAQLSLLASEGVQSAQLLLNPAEMGPVAVQIVLDGQQAQISFHSDQAETRAVLERSLPDLAAALRENGLTLSGGGVFQQDAGTRQQQQGDAATQARGQARGSWQGDAGDHAAALPAAPQRAASARGVLDTYA